MNAKTMIKDLEHDTWLNRGTRAVFVDFAVYNCNINVVCAVKYGPVSNVYVVHLCLEQNETCIHATASGVTRIMK